MFLDRKKNIDRRILSKNKLLERFSEVLNKIKHLRNKQQDIELRIADLKLGNTENPVNPGNLENPGSSGNTGNTGNPGNVGNTGNPGNVGNTGNTGSSEKPGSSGNSGNAGNEGKTKVTIEMKPIKSSSTDRLLDQDLETTRL